MTTIYVGNLSYSTLHDDLRALFEPYGTIVSARVAIDRETQRPRGFGFVEMSDDTAAATAIDALQNTSLGGRKLTVNPARPREDCRSASYRTDDASVWNRRR